MMDFIKNNMLVVGIVVVLIIAAVFFMMRKTSTKTGKEAKPKSSFTIFKKRLDDSKKSSPVATAVMNTEEVNTLFTQLGNDLCGKQFSPEKMTLYMNNPEKVKTEIGLSDVRQRLDINTILVVAIMKSSMPEDKKIDYIATLLLDILLKTTGLPQIEYNKEKAEVKLLNNIFSEMNLIPSAEVISIQEFGGLCYKFMVIQADPDVLKETLAKRNMPQESRDAELELSKKIFNAVKVEQVCSMLN